MDDICYEWEQRNNMVLEFDRVANITQKDVNGYLFQFENGKIESKGSYVKELSPLDYDLPIVNKALVNYMTKKIPVERTILQCDDLIEFQMVRKIGKMYSHLLYGGYWKSERRVNPKTGKMKTFKDFVGDRKRLPERCVRVFASKDPSDGGLWKVKNDGSIAKVEGTPEHCFIYNDAVNGKKCPSVVDKQWYVNTAKSRLKDFGL
jgi:DNA polymerase